MPRIREGCSPEVAAALEVIHKEIMNRVLKLNANGSWHGVLDSGDKKSCWIGGSNSPESVSKCD